MNDLTFVLPAEKHSSTICDVPIEENKGYYLPAPKGKHFDILCHHSVYNRSTIQRILPKDTVYIAIVREPFARFVSAILFFRKDYKEKYLTSIKSDNVISTFLANPRKYEPKGMARSFTNNRMAYDFGLAPKDIKNKSKEKISKFIEKIDNEFDLVMVLEYLDESLILMKRMLNWSLNDILYLGISNAGITNKTAATQNVTEVDVNRHKAWESIDYILYEHFLTKLKRIIAIQDDTFEKELEDFRRARLKVTKYCHGGKLAKDLDIKTFHLKQELRVRPYDCTILKKGAFAYFKMLKQTKEGSKKSKTGSNRKRIIPRMLTNYQIQRKIPRRKINVVRVK
ncbi:hypothetical protein FSP39_018270 [Pinctada imbricata]|uniref:Galactose-3-O-sulfotransferase 3 n=1 Tax=Pinctada imbricata TaxID=66713 RepID=A0AA88XLG0_PINIB|nr:hypothetical protein FSP39_018270 [Pinctada imbricata]